MTGGGWGAVLILPGLVAAAGSVNRPEAHMAAQVALDEREPVGATPGLVAEAVP